MRSDPDEPGLRCAPFEVATSSSAGLQSVFDNGASVDACSWITDGQLAELVRTRSWAARTDARARLLVDNLVLTGNGTASLDNMIASTERGLLLTCLWYIREVDPQTLLLTGLTRDGVYLVENGAGPRRGEQLPLQRVAGRPAGSHHRGRAYRPDTAARVVRLLPRTAMPAVRIPDFNMSTVSQAS